MPRASPASPLLRANSRQWLAVCMPVVHIFSPSMRQPMTPSRVSAHRYGLHVRGVGAMRGFGQTEGDAVAFIEHAVGELGLLFGRAEVAQHQHEGVVGDDRMFGLQVVVQAQALGRQVLADHGHPQVAAVLAAVLFGQGKAQVAGLVGQAPHLLQQRLPFGPRQAVVVEIGARPFAAVVEEALVVVARLQRHDLAFDEGVEFAQVGHQVGGQVEVHVQGSSGCAGSAAANMRR